MGLFIGYIALTTWYLFFLGVRYGAVSSVGAVRFGVVNRTEPHRRLFALLTTAPHRTEGFAISYNGPEQHRAHSIFLETRTESHRGKYHSNEPHRSNFNTSKPHRTAL